MTTRKVYIYALLDPETGYVRYVGQTINLYERYYNHLQEVNSETKKFYHSKNWIRTLFRKEMAPKLEVLETATEDNWQEKERFWISFYKDSGLTNMTDGGEGVLGLKFKPSPKRMKVDVFKVSGEFIKTCESLQEAEDLTKVHNGKISAICKGKYGRVSSKGFIFRYQGDAFSLPYKDMSEAMNHRKLEVFEIDSEGNILNKYQHALLAANNDILLRGRIAKACKDKLCKSQPNKSNSPMRLIKIKGKHYCYAKDYEEIVQSLKKFRSEAINHATENKSEV